MPTVKNVGEPCAREPHARFEVAAGGNQASRASTCRAAQALLADPTNGRGRGGSVYDLAELRGRNIRGRECPQLREPSTGTNSTQAAHPWVDPGVSEGTCTGRDGWMPYFRRAALTQAARFLVFLSLSQALSAAASSCAL